jgi:hypothetical protein
MGTIKLTQNQIDEMLQEIKMLSEELEDFRKEISASDSHLARTYSGSNPEEQIVTIENTILLKKRLLKINELFKHINIL